MVATFLKKAPFLATLLAVLAFAGGSLVFSQTVAFGDHEDGHVGASTDASVDDGDDPVVNEEEEDDEEQPVAVGADDGPAVTSPAPSSPLPPAAPLDPVAGVDDGNDADTGATGLPSTGSGGYLASEGSNSTLYMAIAAVAMVALGGSLVWARSRSR